MKQHTETIQIEGMSCGHCVKAVQSALASIEGVTVEDVAIGRARVSYDAEQVDRGHIMAAIEEEGYSVVGA